MSNNSIKQNRVKNPNWPANQLAIYKRYRGFELGTTDNENPSRNTVVSRTKNSFPNS